jgi:hypothetical protein
MGLLVVFVVAGCGGPLTVACINALKLASSRSFFAHDPNSSFSASICFVGFVLGVAGVAMERVVVVVVVVVVAGCGGPFTVALFECTCAWSTMLLR